jgi:hypothetical protein
MIRMRAVSRATPARQDVDDDPLHVLANLHAFTSWLKRNGNPDWISLSAVTLIGAN